jgi:hypothetical protein
MLTILGVPFLQAPRVGDPSSTVVEMQCPVVRVGDDA